MPANSNTPQPQTGVIVSSSAESYLANAAACEQRARALYDADADIKAYYLATAEQWRTLAIIARIKISQSKNPYQ